MGYVNHPIQLLKIVDAISKLQKKVCSEFYDVLCKVKKGYQPDLEFILEEISFIELIEQNELDPESSSTILSYYLNNNEGSFNTWNT